MTEIIIDTGLKSKIHQVQWEEVCGSVSSTQDIQDYGDYAIIDDFIEKIDDLTEAVSRYPSDSRSMECEAAHKEFGELEKGYKFPGIEQLLPSTYFNPIIFACYKAFVECEFIPHDLDSNTTEEGKIRFMQKLPNISVVKGTLLHPGMIINKNAETPGLGANIKQRFFMDDFIGESLLDSQGNFKGVTVSKTNLDPKNEDKYDNEVDAIAGSTITGDGVTAMIRSDLSLYQPYFNSLNN